MDTIWTGFTQRLKKLELHVPVMYNTLNSKTPFKHSSSFNVKVSWRKPLVLSYNWTCNVEWVYWEQDCNNNVNLKCTIWSLAEQDLNGSDFTQISRVYTKTIKIFTDYEANYLTMVHPLTTKVKRILYLRQVIFQI